MNVKAVSNEHRGLQTVTKCRSAVETALPHIKEVVELSRNNILNNL